MFFPVRTCDRQTSPNGRRCGPKDAQRDRSRHGPQERHPDFMKDHIGGCARHCEHPVQPDFRDQAEDGEKHDPHQPRSEDRLERQLERGGPDTYHDDAAKVRSSASIALIPNRANSAASASSPALPVVSSLSPVKIEFAPAIKHSACAASLMLSRPADRRTMLSGMVIRATATVRTNSISSILASGVSASMLPSTVPLTGTSALTGTLSGGTGRLASAWMKPTRSARVSPMPTMPPQHTLMPAARTLSSVSMRFSNDRVEMTLA